MRLSGTKQVLLMHTLAPALLSKLAVSSKLPLTTEKDKIVPRKKGEAVTFQGFSGAAMQFLM